jgi:tetratricopeptide (TPR) repeat protein
MTRLLLIGAAGLDEPGFRAGLDRDALSNLAKLSARGRTARLGRSPIGEGPAPWASLITGHPPDVHGVFSDREAWAGGLRPVSRASWRVPPIWASLSAAGIATGSVGWPAAGPGRSWPGVHVDASFGEASGVDRASWALPLNCAPADVRPLIRERRVHPADVTGAMLAPFAPGLAAIDQDRDAALPALAVAMAETATLHAAAAWMLESQRADAVFVHYPWLGRVRAGFEGQSDPLFEAVVPNAWRFLDALIGGLVARAPADMAVMVASPGWAGEAGVWLSVGPKAAQSADAADDLLDVAPTVLALFGLADATLPGQVGGWAAARRDLVPAPPAPAAPAVEADPELIRIVVETGYRPPSPPPARWRAAPLATLARSLIDTAPERARAVADEALALDPDNLLAVRVLAMALFALEDPAPLPELAATLDRLAPGRGWGGLALGAYHVLREEIALAEPHLTTAGAEAETDPETLTSIAAVWFAAGRPHQAERVFAAILRQDPQNASAEIGLSMTAAGRLDFRTAEAAIRRALKADPDRPAAHLQLAYVYARSARRAEAARAAATAVRLGASEAAAAAVREGRLPTG